MNRHNTTRYDKRFLLFPASLSREKTKKNYITAKDVIGTAAGCLMIMMIFLPIGVFADHGMSIAGGVILLVVTFLTMYFLQMVFLVLLFTTSTIASIMCWVSGGFLNLFSMLYISMVVLFIITVAPDRKQR